MQELTVRCRRCKNPFHFMYTRGRIRRYCDRCKPIVNQENADRSYEQIKERRKEQFSGTVQAPQSEVRVESQIADAMRHEPARMSVKVSDESHDHGRRCIWEATDGKSGAKVHCITILCMYNPGPFCFMHSQIIEDLAMADMKRRLAADRVRTQQLMNDMREAS